MGEKEVIMWLRISRRQPRLDSSSSSSSPLLSSPLLSSPLTHCSYAPPSSSSPLPLILPLPLLLLLLFLSSPLLSSPLLSSQSYSYSPPSSSFSSPLTLALTLLLRSSILLPLLFLSSPLLSSPLLSSPLLSSPLLSSPLSPLSSPLRKQMSVQISCPFWNRRISLPQGISKGQITEWLPQHCAAQIIKLPFDVADHWPRVQTHLTHDKCITTDVSATSAAEGQWATKMSAGGAAHMCSGTMLN